MTFFSSVFTEHTISAGVSERTTMDETNRSVPLNTICIYASIFISAD